MIIRLIKNDSANHNHTIVFNKINNKNDSLINQITSPTTKGTMKQNINVNNLYSQLVQDNMVEEATLRAKLRSCGVINQTITAPPQSLRCI